MTDDETRRAGPLRVQAADIPSLRALLTLQVAMVVIVALMLARKVLIPITLALLLSFLLAPLIALLRRTGLGRVPASVAAVLLALALVATLLWLVATQLISLGMEVAAHQAVIAHKLAWVRGAGTSAQWQAIDQFRGQLEQMIRPVADGSPGPAPGSVDQADRAVAGQAAPSSMELAREALLRIISPLATASVAMVVTMFILLQREDLRDRVIRLFGSRDLHRTTRAINEAATRLSRYFLTQLAVDAGFGCASTVGLAVTGCRGRYYGACSPRCCASCPISVPSCPRSCRYCWRRRSSPAGAARSRPRCCSSCSSRWWGSSSSRS